MVVGAAIALLAVLVAVVVVLVVRDVGRAVPSFPGLAADPDPALRGTVAYFDDSSGCVRIVAAAGAPDREVYCLPAGKPGPLPGPDEVADVPVAWKRAGPQLVWQPGGRLEVTMFAMAVPTSGDRPGFEPTYRPLTTKVVDVATGKVADRTPPAALDLTTRPVVNAGRRIRITGGDDSGRAEIGLSDASGARTLVSVRGPRFYRFNTAFWAPGGEWIAADDGRILVVTPGDPATTRVLTDASSAVTFGGSEEGGRISRFAVTGEDLLRP